MNGLVLDVATPKKVPQVLRWAADRYRGAAQDPSSCLAGSVCGNYLDGPRAHSRSRCGLLRKSDQTISSMTLESPAQFDQEQLDESR